MEVSNSNLININCCSIKNKKSVLLENISWKMQKKQAWLLIGPNGGGKADFVNALSGKYEFLPEEKIGTGNFSNYSNIFENSCEVVSLERAALLIEEERKLDESEYIEGGVDIGRTGRIFIAEGITGPIKKGFPIPEIAKKIEAFPAVKLCGVEKILDRGIKYMSTGEIRRTLLARALISGKKLLILSDPFAGLDVESRKILLEFFNTITSKQLSENFDDSGFPYIILCMERYYEIPSAITNVLEFSNKKISFSGTKDEYEKKLESEKAQKIESSQKETESFKQELSSIKQETFCISNQAQNGKSYDAQKIQKTPLVEMKNVNVGWDEKLVLKNFNWTLYPGEHWLIRGPNGSGKTTFLELITGDNPQVFSNDIKIFGSRRGTGETIWDIKHKLGIVSYRLHVEYRMLKNVSLKEVIISGFHDSIGLYEKISDVELTSAKKWLKLGGFEGRENELFSSLSYGEQRAILILRAVVKSPEILILDEPCHGLDDSFREKILCLLELIAKSGTTTLLHVTHEFSEVLPCEKHILEFTPNEEPMYKISKV